MDGRVGPPTAVAQANSYPNRSSRGVNLLASEFQRKTDFPVEIRAGPLMPGNGVDARWRIAREPD